MNTSFWKEHVPGVDLVLSACPPSAIDKLRTWQAEEKERVITERYGPSKLLSFDKNGKPIAIDNEYISISHSGELMMMSFSSKDHGIDLQEMNHKLIRIRTKFVSEREMSVYNCADLRSLCLLWCIKESVFKLYGTEVPFKEVECDFLNTSASFGSGLAHFRGQELNIFYDYFDRFCLTLAWKQ